MMRAAYIMLAGLMLVACRRDTAPEDNSVAANAAVDQPAAQCTPPTLVLANGDRSPASKQLDETKANFANAYQRSCTKGVLKTGPLIDPAASDQKQMLLVNAPEANVASIYLSEIDGNRMVLEYPFLTTDGKSQVPSADELEEAIYCSVHGATPEEQEETGRCLVD